MKLLAIRAALWMADVCERRAHRRGRRSEDHVIRHLADDYLDARFRAAHSVMLTDFQVHGSDFVASIVEAMRREGSRR